MVLLRAKEAEVYVGDAIDTVSSTATIFSQLTSIMTLSARIKSLEISGAENDVETVYLFGTDSDGRQNAELEEQNTTDRELSGTLIFVDNSTAELSTAEAETVGSTGYTRIQGDGAVTPRCIILKLTDEQTGDDLIVTMNNARFTKMGDISLDAEGHAEQEIAAKCLAKDYFEEFKAGA